MPYTEFRKSYSDFEVVIPPIDFSSLTIEEATKTAKALRSYERNFVCQTLVRKEAYAAVSLINKMIHTATNGMGKTIGQLIKYQLDAFKKEIVPLFRVGSQHGNMLRKAWCDHMANEIEREFGFTHW